MRFKSLTSWRKSYCCRQNGFAWMSELLLHPYQRACRTSGTVTSHTQPTAAPAFAFPLAMSRGSLFSIVYFLFYEFFSGEAIVQIFFIGRNGEYQWEKTDKKVCCTYVLFPIFHREQYDGFSTIRYACSKRHSYSHQSKQGLEVNLREILFIVR